VALLVRPQEALQAVQSLALAYLEYFDAVADANRAQFRLYRALGQPAECLANNEELPKLPPPNPTPAKLPTLPEATSTKVETSALIEAGQGDSLWVKIEGK
jgi:hypothetical protein